MHFRLTHIRVLEMHFMSRLKNWRSPIPTRSFQAMVTR